MNHNNWQGKNLKFKKKNSCMVNYWMFWVLAVHKVFATLCVVGIRSFFLLFDGQVSDFASKKTVSKWYTLKTTCHCRRICQRIFLKKTPFEAACIIIRETRHQQPEKSPPFEPCFESPKLKSLSSRDSHFCFTVSKIFINLLIYLLLFCWSSSPNWFVLV